jgi:outer membrane biogenesis lipoprotein LolB
MPMICWSKRLGVRLPVNGLRYWVRGLPEPGSTPGQTDADGRLTRLEQNGWVIEYPAYANRPSASRSARTHRRPAHGSQRQTGD